MKKKYFLSTKRLVVILVLNFTLLSCSDKQDNSVASSLAGLEEQAKKELNLKIKDKTKIENWLVDKKGIIKPKLKFVDRSLDDQEAGLLEADRKESEIELHDLIQELDDNLDNPTVREELAEKMEQSTVEYKQKMLLLAKDKLKKQQSH